MYNGANISVKVDNQVSGSVPTSEELLQGEILSPILHVCRFK